MDVGHRDRDDGEPVGTAGGLEPGWMLNGIYRIERFVSRGGMGDVYAGVNIETDERVAIKAMLPRLAADPKILSLFRSEARLLTRVSHPAVAQYRVFARDPALGLHYLVTDFIDGEALTARLAGDRPDPGEVERLLRRLASGLRVPHAIGAIHRDMSPDNILLPGGRIADATIIDFGIARYVEPDDRTVVIEGFAGKLGYVAPEQFGLFGGRIGPWTDIYSTALVTLAFARADRIDMGRTIVEAVEKRGTVPDLDAVHESLRPALRAMLIPDPGERAISMDAVMAMLDASSGIATPTITPRSGPVPASATQPATRTPRRPMLLASLAAVAALAIALGLVVSGSRMFGRTSHLDQGKLTHAVSPRAIASPGHAVATSRLAASRVAMIAPQPAAATAPDANARPLEVAAGLNGSGLRVGTRGCGPGPGVWSGATASGLTKGAQATLLFVAPSGEVRTVLAGDPPRGSPGTSVRMARKDRYRVSMCLHEPGRAAYVLVIGAGEIPILHGGDAVETVDHYRDLVAQRGGSSRVAWLSVEPQTRNAARPTGSVVGEDGGARATLGRGGAILPAVGSCRRFVGGTWYDLGTLPREECVTKAFDRDRVVYAHVGGSLVRRYGGGIEVQRGATWRRIGAERARERDGR